jgi:SAM-dependent methyltransferase
MAAQYDAARALPPAALDAWRRAVAPFLQPQAGLPILDLGSGTGQFAEAFARWFDHPVVGVEPSRAMRREAERKRSHPGIRYLAGDAEQIPLLEGSCGAAWLSTVLHHVTDLAACAHELRRVLAPGAPVLIRNAFPGRQGGITLFRFFPEAGAVVETFPSVAATLAAFAPAGFELELLLPVAQESAPSLADVRRRLASRADTTLAALSESEFERGLAALDAAIRAGRDDGPVVDWLDLVVLR